MIVLCGNDRELEYEANRILTDLGYAHYTGLDELNVHLAGARTAAQLLDVIERQAGKPMSFDKRVKQLAESQPYLVDFKETYIQRIEIGRQEFDDKFYIYDLRPLWFLADLTKLVQPIKVLAMIADKGKIASVIKELTSNHEPLLILGKADKKAIQDFVK